MKRTFNTDENSCYAFKKAVKNLIENRYDFNKIEKQIFNIYQTCFEWLLERYIIKKIKK